MSLIRWQPLKELDTLRQRMNHLFDEVLHREREFTLFPKLEGDLWAPAIELQETDKEVILKAVVPGIEAKELDVQVSENTVAIAGEHRAEKHTEKQGYFHSELQYGQFQRLVPLPVAIKPKEVQAQFKDGVLTLILPKAESAQRNVVKIDLTLQEKARESVTEQRQHEEQLDEKVHSRAAEAIQAPDRSGIPEETRELTTEQRLHDEHLQDTTHKRTVDEVNKPLTS